MDFTYKTYLIYEKLSKNKNFDSTNLSFNAFINEHNVLDFCSLKITRQVRKSYVNIMIWQNLVLLSIYLIHFEWSVVLVHFSIYVFSFLYLDQYHYYVEYKISNKIQKIKICREDIDLFLNLEKGFNINKFTQESHVNEAIIKRNI